MSFAGWEIEPFRIEAPRVQEIWVVAPLIRQSCVENLHQNFLRQKFEGKRLVVICPTEIDLGDMPCDKVVRGKFNVGRARRAGTAVVPKDSYVVSMDDDDWYGPDYLTEHAGLAQPNRIVGKQLHWIDFEEPGLLVLLRPHVHSKPVSFLSGGTIAGFAGELEWPEVELSEDVRLCHDFKLRGGEVLHSSIYQVRYRRRREAMSHTYVADPWNVVAEQGGNWYRVFPGLDPDALVCGQIPEPGCAEVHPVSDLIPLIVEARRSSKSFSPCG